MLILLQIQRKEEVEYHIHSFIYPKFYQEKILKNIMKIIWES